MQAKYEAKKREGDPKQIDDPNKKITVLFYKTEAGGEPVRDWLKSLSTEEKKLIGADIKTVEYGWPIGMPACRPLGKGLFEVRTNLPTRIARVIFYVDKQQRMILLHGFIKKTPKTDEDDLELARSNRSKHEKGTNE
jgi:phage-related protein